MILTNPPFGSIINLAEKPYLSTYELGNNVDVRGKKKPRKNQSSEVLFIERIWKFLKPGIGQAAIVLPDGILTNMKFDRFIVSKCQHTHILMVLTDTRDNLSPHKRCICNSQSVA